MGFCAFVHKDKEYMLLEIVDLDRAKFKVYQPNLKFRSFTLEIGAGRKYLGDSSHTRKLIAAEYTNYHYDMFLENLPNMAK